MRFFFSGHPSSEENLDYVVIAKQVSDYIKSKLCYMWQSFKQPRKEQDKGRNRFFVESCMFAFFHSSWPVTRPRWFDKDSRSTRSSRIPRAPWTPWTPWTWRSPWTPWTSRNQSRIFFLQYDSDHGLHQRQDGTSYIKNLTYLLCMVIIITIDCFYRKPYDWTTRYTRAERGAGISWTTRTERYISHAHMMFMSGSAKQANLVTFSICVKILGRDVMT